MATFSIEPSQETVHGNFSREHAPILTIDSGDTVVFRTLDAGWQTKHRTTPDEEPLRLQLEDGDKRKDNGHCLCGPVAIRGAKPGMTLEIRIDEIVTGSWGWTGSGGWPHRVHTRLGTDKHEAKLVWQLANGEGTSHLGHKIKLRPFMGVMGMPPDEDGFHSTAPPRFCGGNMDCKELIAGTSLYLPVPVEGALFSVGDGHAVQGDGEACVTAIECPMERVVLTFVLHPAMRIAAPMARIGDAWLTMGLDEDLNEASLKAVEGMLDLLQEKNEGLDRSMALAVASLAVDLRVTQIVNGVQGVHAILRDDAIRFPAT